MSALTEGRGWGDQEGFLKEKMPELSAEKTVQIKSWGKAILDIGTIQKSRGVTKQWFGSIVSGEREREIEL